VGNCVWVEVNFDYEAFGTAISPMGMPTTIYLFAGEETDTDAKLTYLRARYLNLYSGRFVTNDQYEGDVEIPASFNKYVYADSNPICAVDPSGNFSQTAGLMTSIAVIGILAVAINFWWGGKNTQLTTKGTPNSRAYLMPYVQVNQIELPDGVDIDRNIRESTELSLSEWLTNRVPFGHVWDFKTVFGTRIGADGKRVIPDRQRYQRLANLANFNFGATGKAINVLFGKNFIESFLLGESFLLRGAGGAEATKYLDNFSGSLYGEAQGVPFWGAPYGDNPRDQIWIKKGFEYFDKFYAR
jgi:RHS repeat-associated protein